MHYVELYETQGKFMYKKIIKAFFTAGIFLTAILLSYGYFLTNILSDTAIPDKLLHGNAFYIIQDNPFFDYARIKDAVHAARNPSVIAIGSSRVLPFRESFFTKSFANLGYGIGSISDMEKTYQILKERKKEGKEELDIILFGIDFWWFSNGYDDAILGDPPRWYTPLKYLPVFSTIRECLLPYKKIWLKPGYLKSLVIPYFQDVFMVQDGSYPLNIARIGPDGSGYYTDIVVGRRKSDIRFGETLQAIWEGHFHFSRVKKINLAYVDKFMENVKKLRSLHKNIIFFFPPLANPVYTELRSREAEYQHVFSLKQIFEERGIVVHDYSSLSSFGSNDCEMVDGFHGGDVSYARILLHLAAASPQVKGVINEPYLREVTEEFSGNAMIPDKRVTLDPEVDFLELQCAKGRRRSASH